MARKNWWAWLRRQLELHNITMADFKKNPREAYLKNAQIRTWLHQSFRDNYENNQTIKWFNNTLNLRETFTEVEWNYQGNKY